MLVIFKILFINNLTIKHNTISNQILNLREDKNDYKQYKKKLCQIDWKHHWSANKNLPRFLEVLSLYSFPNLKRHYIIS